MEYEEVDAMLSGRKMTTKVSFLNKQTHILEYDAATTVQEAVEALAKSINLEHFTTFTLYEIRRNVIDEDTEETVAEDYVLLDDNRYIADILADIQFKMTGGLLFKKRMFREHDESINEPTFINLSYVQAQHDYLIGNYPVVKDDAAQLCALQILALHGPHLEEMDDVFMKAVETHLIRQVNYLYIKLFTYYLHIIKVFKK